jgi:hypothetical protein
MGISSAALTLLILLGGSVLAPPAQAAVVVGVCTIKANLTHGSVHVSGTINGTGSVSCDIVMEEIYLKVSIEKSNGTIVNGTVDDYFNTAYENGNAATSCSNAGTWRTRSSYALRAPAGYNPSYASGTTYSAWSNVVCGASRIAPDGAVETPEPYVETTVEITAPDPS